MAESFYAALFMFGYVHRLIYMRLRSRAHGVFFVLNFQRYFFPCAPFPSLLLLFIHRSFSKWETNIYTHTHTQATRAINMKYCLIEDIVLKTLPRAFFLRFFYYSLFIYYFPSPHPHRSPSSLIVYTLSRRTLFG